MDPMPKNPLTAIERLEQELIVRDFIAAVNGGLRSDDELLLHPLVTYRGSSVTALQGRRSVAEMCSNLREALQGFRFDIVRLVSSDMAVLVEEQVRFTSGDGQVVEVPGFASFQIEDSMIRTWRRLTG